jgi:probable F420-dependent oxidoreductase
MKIDAGILVPNLLDIPRIARAAEEIGFDALWTSETQREPFLPLAIAAEHTSRIKLGTSIAVAFARSPTNLAHIAWDLAQASRGRFILGLGTQIKAHIERRFAMPWDERVAPRFREMVLAIRAVWNAWQGDGRVNFRGEFYKITLMTPFFNPGPIEFPAIPIFIAGVNEHLCRVAGETCQGFHVHPFHTTKYIREIVLPNVERGAKIGNRLRSDIQLSSAVFVASNDVEREEARRQISFYASTPTYRTVLSVHGWEDAGERLSALAVRGKWDEMPALITDEILAQVAIVAPLHEIPNRIKSRYAGLLDRVTFYTPFDPKEAEKWRELMAGFSE